MKLCYTPRKFNDSTQLVILRANDIIQEYRDAGYTLTLRQLYYQFVSRGLMPNKLKSYKRLSAIMADARLAGAIDWEAIVDNTRNLDKRSSWSTVKEMMYSAAAGYHRDMWEDQPYRVQIWLEKDALSGIFSNVCWQYDVPLLSCRGYTSISEMWLSAMRLVKYIKEGQSVVVLHFGDHDPSGIDMTRDIIDRVGTFLAGHRIHRGFRVERIALNYDQVVSLSLPPNPVKLSDSRSGAYTKDYGDESWELDALDPRTLRDLAEEEIKKYVDEDIWNESVDKIAAGTRELEAACKHWPDIRRFMFDHGWLEDDPQE